LSLVSNPVWDFHGQDLKAQPSGGVCPVWGPQNFLSAICRLCGSALVASSDWDLQHALGWIAVNYEAVGMRFSTSKSEAMDLCWKMVDCSLQVGSFSPK